MFEDIEKRWDNPTEEEQKELGRKPGQGKPQFDGIEQDLKYLEKTLPFVYKIWGRTVHLET